MMKESERKFYTGVVINMLEDADLRTLNFVYIFLLRTLTRRR